jgi:hypothetical protein
MFILNTTVQEHTSLSAYEHEEAIFEMIADGKRQLCQYNPTEWEILPRTKMNNI